MTLDFLSSLEQKKTEQELRLFIDRQILPNLRLKYPSEVIPFRKTIPWTHKQRCDVIPLRLHLTGRGPSGDRGGVLL